jgi:cytochrome c oxidase subunit I
MKFFSTAFFKGLIYQILGSVLGAGFVMLIRFITGLTPYQPEPVIAGGALIGAIAFLFGVGVFGDWLKWTKGISTSDHQEHDSNTPGWWRYFNVDFDHKIIGIQYGVTSLVVLGLGGLFAILFRIELSTAGLDFLENGLFNFLIDPNNIMKHTNGSDLFNSFMSLHGMVMIASILLGVGAMTNYLVPLLIGANDMAFPRLNAFAYWVNVPGALLLVSSLAFGGVNAGWTSYPPLTLSEYAPIGIQLFMMGVYMVGLSSIFGSINVLVTVTKMRAPGMTWFKMPIFVWAAFATSIIQLTATQMIGLSFQLVIFQRLFGMNFFNAGGGDPVLFQHLFWFYSHPAVYVFILPGLGIISELLPVFSRKPLFGYKWIAFSSLAIAIVGFFVWAHHMFTSGMSSYLRVPFMYATLLVAVPTGVKFFSWVGTMWKGKLRFPAPMLFVLGAVFVFLVGGITGPPNGTVATDLVLHDTYWVVGHFHNTIFGGFIFPFFAALYYWFPKMTGKRLGEKLGKWQFWLLFIGFEGMSLTQMRIGLLGMRRRIATYDPALDIEDAQLWITYFGLLVAVSVIICFYNVIKSVKSGEIAEGNIWQSRSPEWQIPNPAPNHNYAHPFLVTGEPYDYGAPDNPEYVDMNPTPAGD